MKERNEQLFDLTEAEYAELSSDSWFDSLSASMQQQLLQQGKRRSIEAQQKLFSRGDAFCGIYVVLSGQLLISGLHQSGQQALLTLITPGQWLGEIALFDQMPRTHDAVALHDTELWQISRATLQKMVQLDPLWWQAFGQLLTGKLRQVFVELEDRAVLSASQRLARRLYQLSQHQNAIPLQQEQLGQLLSLSRQTTNQLLRQLVADGLIQTRYGAIDILDRTALFRIAQS